MRRVGKVGEFGAGRDDGRGLGGCATAEMGVKRGTVETGWDRNRKDVFVEARCNCEEGIYDGWNGGGE